MLATFAGFGERIATSAGTLWRCNGRTRMIGLHRRESSRQAGEAPPRKLYAANEGATNFRADYFSAAILLINSSTRQLSRSFS